MRPRLYHFGMKGYHCEWYVCMSVDRKNVHNAERQSVWGQVSKQIVSVLETYVLGNNRSDFFYEWNSSGRDPIAICWEKAFPVQSMWYC